MEIRIKNDSVEIEGYVNAVERNSKPLWSRMGQFIERVCKGAFKKALKRADNVQMLLNHDPERVLASTRDGNLELTEDNIGLHARATITDKDVVEDAKNGNLVGWSFGFEDTDDGVERAIDSETGLPLRKLRDLNLHEVSILNRAKSPAYEGTLVTVRADEKMHFRAEAFIDDVKVLESETRENDSKDAENGSNAETRLTDESNNDKPQQTQSEAIKIDYSKYEQMISEMKGETTK